MGRSSQVKDIKQNRLDKQSEKEKRSKVYTTERIEQIIKDQATGGSPDMDPFFHGLTDYRDQGIAFEYTDHELAELEKCSNDCIYFVENYCKFLNDKGVTLVKLRDYQKRLLNLMSAEKYDEVSDSIIPENRRIVVMQSRQTGKCVTGDTLVDILEELDYSKLTFKYYIKTKWVQFQNYIQKCTYNVYNLLNNRK